VTSHPPTHPQFGLQQHNRHMWQVTLQHTHSSVCNSPTDVCDKSPSNTPTVRSATAQPTCDKSPSNTPTVRSATAQPTHVTSHPPTHPQFGLQQHNRHMWQVTLQHTHSSVCNSPTDVCDKSPSNTPTVRSATAQPTYVTSHPPTHPRFGLQQHNRHMWQVTLQHTHSSDHRQFRRKFRCLKFFHYFIRTCEVLRSFTENII